MSRTPAEQRALLVDADTELRATARRIASETRAAQDLPPKVEDLPALRRVATLMKPAPGAANPPSARQAASPAGGSGRALSSLPFSPEPPPGDGLPALEPLPGGEATPRT